MASYTIPGKATELRASRLVAPAESQPWDALSVDVEDYFHVEAFADRVSPSDWHRFPARVCRNVERILALLAKHRCRATFFVLGWVAEREPQLLRTIASAGHEIGCHGYAHRRLTSLSPAQFREDLKRATGAIEAATGARPLGFRAPTFSIARENLWALEILAEEDFCYDSSIFPVRHDLYGYPEFPRFPQLIRLASARAIVEIPMATTRLWGINLPCAGGGYLRLLPLAYTRWAMRRIHRADKRSVVVYFHPWELDPDQPRLSGSWKSRLRHYRGLRGFERKLERVLAAGSFKPLIDLATQLSPASSTARIPSSS